MPFSTGDRSPPGPSSSPAPVGWQERALARSLADARTRSVERLARFVGAARQLAEESGSASFTVQQVVERSGASLKSFYRYFGSKDDLVLALLEEDCALGAELLADAVHRRDDTEERVRAWVVGLFRLMAVGDVGYVRVLVREYRRFAEERPGELGVVLAPFLDLLAGELAAGMAAGAVRRGDPAKDAATVLDLVLAKISAIVVAPEAHDLEAEATYVWAFCWGGLSAGAAT